MPTTAQRLRQQRAAAAAGQGAARPVGDAVATTSTAKRAQAAATTSKAGPSRKLPAPVDSAKDVDIRNDDGAAFSDDDSDSNDVAAFEMDGQDVWTQNYCATCDCLIEPGQGVNARSLAEKRQSQQSAAAGTAAQASATIHSESTSASTTVVQSPVDERPRSNTGLKSKAGTIKARPPSSDGTSTGTASGSKVKRTNSAGRLHAVGGTGFGAGKRTGSAGSRLNALSELRPTTKLNAAAPAEATTSKAKANTALSRQSSTTSNKSSNHSRPGSSGPSSPAGANAALPRSKKGGLLGALTPAALQQQEELENAKARAPGALYCSERCREIDEQKSQGLGELVYYMQPTSPTNYWAPGAAVAGPSSYGARSNRTSTGSITSRPPSTRVYYRGYTPESECMCQDCLEKNSIGGTIPSGASDTAESSVSYNHAHSKRRTQSGRLMTPQNLYSPAQGGTWSTDYFGPQATTIVKQTAQNASARGVVQGDTSSQTGTESSARSDGSASSEMWEPCDGSGTARAGQGARHYSADQQTTRDSVYSQSAQTRGSATTGTITPARARNESSRDERQDATSRQASHADIQAVLQTKSDEGRSSTSPMRLLRRGDHHAEASVDVTPDHATSPQPSSSFLSRSVASERTEDGASSGVTLAPHAHAPSSSFLERRVLRRPSSRTSISGITAQNACRLGGDRFTDSPAPDDASGGAARTSSALGSLMSAANGQGRIVSPAPSAIKTGVDPRRPSLAQSHASTTSSNGSGGWLRSSISSAWNSLRGLPSSERLSSQDVSQVRDSVPSLHVSDVERGSDEDQSEEYTRQQTLVHRPTIKRGKVPSFAEEIGKGDIPGGESGRRSTGSDSSRQPDSAGLPKSMAEQQDIALQEERLRRRQERERAARHQRSKDVTQLPPLLGVAQHGSSSNLHGMRGGRAMSSTSLASTGSYDAQALYGLRSTTPGLNRRSMHGGSGTSLADLGTSPGRISNMAAFGTSPRRAGLGWGAMTPIAQFAPLESHTPRSSNPHHQHVVHRPGHHQHHHSMHGNGGMTRNAAIQAGHQAKHRSHGGVPAHGVAVGHLGMLGMHPHGHAPIYGRHATTPVRMSTPSVPEHGGEMSSAALKGEDETESSDEEEEAQRQRRQISAASGAVHLSRSFGKRVNLDPMPPPQRPRSGMSMRGMTPVADYTAPPLRPLSRTQTAKHERGGSHDLGQHASSTKLYPVLDVPNREPTHDRYGLGWGNAEAGIEDLLPRRTSASSQNKFGGIERGVAGKASATEQTLGSEIAPSSSMARVPSNGLTAEEAARQHRAAAAAAHARKKLFYFDNS